MLSLPEVVLLAMAGVVAGATNSVAGGGSLVSFPALLALGYAPLTANITNTVSMWPGYASGTLAFRPELRGQRHRLVGLGATVVAGAAVGAALLIVLPGSVFDVVVPWLVLASAGLLAVQPRVARRLRARAVARADAGRPLRHLPVELHVALFAGAAYGAYFGGGLGVVLLAVLGSFLDDTLHRINGLKSALSLVINTVALGAFVVFGPVAWEAFAVLAPAALVGGTLGARVARRLPERGLRAAIVAVGVAVGLVLLVR